MKIISYILLVFFLFSTSTFADEALEDPRCNTGAYDIDGSNAALVNYTQEFAIKVASGAVVPSQVDFTLVRDGEKVETKQGPKYVRIFNKSGVVDIEAQITYETCTQTLKKTVQIYDQSYVYMGDKITGIEENFGDFFKKKNTYFVSYGSKDVATDFASSLGAYDFVNKHIQELSQAKILFIDEAFSINILDALLKAQKNQKDTLFEGKDIFIITSKNYSFLSKVIAPYISQIGIKKIGFIKQDSFIDSVSSLLGDGVGSISYISFEKQSSFLSLNTFIRYLTYSGLELSLVGFFLSISLAILVVNFSKQFIGLNAFGVYYPIFLALCLTLLNLYFVAVFLLLGFFAIFLTSLLGKKVYLLYFSKRAVLMTLFLILTLIFLGIDNYFGLSIVPVETFSNKFILFPFLFLLLIADKVLHEEVKVFSKKGLYYFAELILITFICYGVINSSTIQYFMLSYPDILFLVCILNILVGKYTGLQLMEYVRFSPLIKKLSEEEE